MRGILEGSLKVDNHPLFPASFPLFFPAFSNFSKLWRKSSIIFDQNLLKNFEKNWLMCFNIFFKIVHQKIEKTSQFFKISIFSKKKSKFQKKNSNFSIFEKFHFFFKIFDFFKFWVFSKFSCFLKNFMFWKILFFFRNFWLFLYFSFLASKILSFHWFWSWCWFHFQHDLWYFKIKTMLSIHFEVCGIFCKQRPDVMLYRSWLWGKRKSVLRVESWE